MLLNLHVKNFAIIDEVDITLKDGLNILTGETGAGKSIIIGSVNVCLGGKISKDIIRHGAEYAMVELLFESGSRAVINKMQELDLPMEDGQILITRKITNGKSISKINGETVTAQSLKEIAGLLIDIHGQHEHQSLLYKENYLDIIDRFAREEASKVKQKLAKEYNTLAELKKQLTQLTIEEDKRLREISYLEYEVSEIKEANLRPGEDEELTSEYKKLSNARIIAEGLSQVYEQMGYQAAGSAGDMIGRSVKQLAKLMDYDKGLNEFYNQSLDLEALVNEFNRNLSEYTADLSNHEEDFKEVEERLNLINHLKAKYGNSIEEIAKVVEEGERKLEQYYHYEETLRELNQSIAVQEKEVRSLSEKLSEIRTKNSRVLSARIKEALVDLNFLDVSFAIELTRKENYTQDGFDDAEFLISVNPGEELKNLSKVASGGELSRIMLAIKSVFADKDEIESLIFDEIDTGISGRTAQKVSEKLSEISGSHQVICITHLAQIASMADTHYIIEKNTDGRTTRTEIRQLKDQESIEEIARILGGARITKTVIESAEEMKQLAKKTKQK
ncbi:DNA replication and repair protein RecN [Anaerocolumna jejuensis DSM 15929]|uniref:DNA repair protein RecN n=1 Tax=Anaerocolumna jejuensis DSM 15929 TaxID=1121322 RepID=A0A1M6MK20_9FIRM|nr:DNA repair protein RecN [Anaerocolumna jejuensis]SHJ83839.1 DNA replication and repair protein RecN [Anaerocolumna jejuensis DSM 15929]